MACQDPGSDLHHAAHSADTSYFKISELRQSATVKEQAARSVKLFWGDEKVPEFALQDPMERHLPDVPLLA